LADFAHRPVVMDTLKSLPDDENKEVIVWLVQNALAVPNDFKYFV